MKPIRSAALVVALLAGSAALAGDDVPSFKKRGDAEKKFVERVGTAIVKAARSKPAKVELDSYEYKHNTPKAGRTELLIKMTYQGILTKRKYNADIKVKIDSSDRNNWEVLNIDYKDTNTNPIGPSQKKIQELIKQLNK